MSVNAVPTGFHTIAPNIIVKSVDAAVSFYERAFGAVEILRLCMADGKVVHCELKFGDSRLNLGESMEGWPEHTLLAQIFVADSDAVFAQAVKAGAEDLGESLRIRRAPSIPFRLGSPTSNNIKSGWSRAALLIASNPSAASPTICKSGVLSSTEKTHRRNGSKSSTTRTRTDDALRLSSTQGRVSMSSQPTKTDGQIAFYRR